MKRYALRQAAGIYWLLELDQPLGQFRKPVAMNEVGAAIWRKYTEGQTEAEIASSLCREYDMSEEELRADIAAFLDGLRSMNVI